MYGPDDFLVVGLEPDLEDESLTRVYLTDRDLGLYVVVYPDGKAEIEDLLKEHLHLFIHVPPQVPRYFDKDD